MKVFEKLLKYNKVLAEWSDAVEWSSNVDAVTQRASKNVTIRSKEIEKIHSMRTRSE